MLTGWTAEKNYWAVIFRAEMGLADVLADVETPDCSSEEEVRCCG